MHAHALATDERHEEHESGRGDAAHAVRAAGAASVRRMLVDTEHTALRLRSVPMPGRNIIGKLPRHSTVEAIGATTDGYAEVRDARGQVGWAALRYLRPEGAALARTHHHETRPAPLPGDMNRQQCIPGVPFVKGEGDEHDIDPNDVKQGELGDCYFLASAAAVARANPELIRKLIRKIDAHNYEVTLYPADRSGGETAPTKVIVSDMFPIQANGLPAYAYTGDVGEDGPELWVMLLEKAYATQAGRYAAIDGGEGSAGLNLLLAGGSKSYQVSNYSADALGDIFHEALRRHRPLVTNTGSDDGFLNQLRTKFPWLPEWLYDNRVRRQQAVGAYSLHEYAIKSVDVRTRHIQIQNPWGDHHLDISFDDYRTVFVEFAVGNP
jgi:hypothetical protein